MSLNLKEIIKKYVMNLGADDMGIGATADSKSAASPVIVFNLIAE